MSDNDSQKGKSKFTWLSLFGLGGTEEEEEEEENDNWLNLFGFGMDDVERLKQIKQKSQNKWGDDDAYKR